MCPDAGAHGRTRRLVPAAFIEEPNVFRVLAKMYVRSQIPNKAVRIEKRSTQPTRIFILLDNLKIVVPHSL